jgi:hypothetical protein
MLLINCPWPVLSSGHAACGHCAQASRRAILNANYMAARLKDDYTVLFTGDNGTCAHEFIIDLRPLKDSAGAPAAQRRNPCMEQNPSAAIPC